MYIEIAVPYTESEIGAYLPAPIATQQNRDLCLAYTRFLHMSWDEVVRTLTARMDTTVHALLASPNARLFMECAVREQITQFINHCRDSGYPVVAGWAHVVGNIGNTMGGFQFEFTYKRTQE